MELMDKIDILTWETKKYGMHMFDVFTCFNIPISYSHSYQTTKVLNFC